MRTELVELYVSLKNAENKSYIRDNVVSYDVSNFIEKLEAIMTAKEYIEAKKNISSMPEGDYWAKNEWGY